MEAVFGPEVDEAVLLGPPFQSNGTACLQFQYRLTHPKILLRILTTPSSASNSSSFSTAPEGKNFSYEQQMNASNWNEASVSLIGGDIDELQQVVFIAEKIGFTVDLQSITIRKILLSTDFPKCQNRGDDFT